MSQKNVASHENFCKAKNGSKSGGVGADGISNCLEKNPADFTPLFLEGKYRTKILLVRHGESQGNARHAFLGHTDLDLSPRGYEQAKRTAKFLLPTPIDKIYTSDLQRAFNTGVEIGNAKGLTPEPNSALRELFLGKWEGMTVADINEKYSDLFEQWKNDFGTFCCPGGESVAHLQSRIYDEVLRLAKLNEGKTILLSFHAAAIRVLYAKVAGVSLEDLNGAFNFPYNASVSVIYFDGEKLIEGEYSHMQHLTDI